MSEERKKTEKISANGILHIYEAAYSSKLFPMGVAINFSIDEIARKNIGWKKAAVAANMGAQIGIEKITRS